MKLTVSEIIINYDAPLVVLAQNDKGAKFIGINYCIPEDGGPYSFYFVQPRPKYLLQFQEQKIDLRYIVTHASYKRKFHAITWSDLEETIDCSTFDGEILEDMLPEPRLFNPNPIPRSQLVKSKKISIDGRWDVADLSLFSDLVRDCYSFAHAIIKGPTHALKSTFEHYPWRGGSSSLNFFKELSKAIRTDERAKLTKMQYASPGFIEFSLREDVSDLIKSLVENINNQESSAKSSYVNARVYLRRKSLLTRSAEDVKTFNDNEIEELKEILSNLCESFGLSNHKDKIIGLSQNNTLAGIKILLAFYRRLSKFADYSATGKAVGIFE